MNEKIDYLDKIKNYSANNYKQRPPISPITHETRELAKKSLLDFNEKAAEAQKKAQETNKTIEINGSDLSGVTSGDFWIIDQNGIKERYFSKNDGLIEGLTQRRTERVADADKTIDMQLLLDILSLAQWAPNATNEQPTKVMIYGKDHPTMEKIGAVMHQALYENMIPKLNLRNYILMRKQENPNFMADYSYQDLLDMNDEHFSQFNFEKMPAPLNELPQTTAKLIERGKIIIEKNKYYKKKADGSKDQEYTVMDLLLNDRVFTAGMGKFFLKFKNTHPYLIVVFRKWHYTSLMTETLYKYGIKLPDVGEEFIDAGCYTDHLALAARAYGLSGVIKTGPLDLAKNELIGLFIDDLEALINEYQKTLDTQKGLSDKKTDLVKAEIKKAAKLYQSLKYGQEAIRSQQENTQMREALITALKRGEVYVPACFYQLGYPLAQPEERVREPRQGKNMLHEMLIYML